jgi:adenylate cyclase
VDKALEDGQLESGAELATRTNRRLTWVGVPSNGLGALLVFVFLGFLVPTTVDPDEYGSLLVRSVAVFVVYMAVALPLGRYWSQNRTFAPLDRWLREERPATESEQVLALRYPLSSALTAAVFWCGAAVVFSLLNVSAGLGVAVSIGVTILLGALSACALQYLLTERVMRPVTARALAGGAHRRRPRLATPGVAARLTMAWTLATGVPLLGITALAVMDLAGADLDEGQVVSATLFLAALALAVGLLTMLVAARSVADPVGSMRGAVERVERGDFEARALVDDGSEVGQLQAGFNRMAAGLQERERLREAFGTFVDPGLTERVLAEGTDLAGEEVELSVMFIDVRGFTGFAEQAEAQEVVAFLNDLYGLIVPILLRHGGHATKFIGDGLLAVFGAPERLLDHAERAVAAALEIARAVDERFGDECRVGVGVNSGRVVVGTIGGGGRLDFTVIGDPVNTAARVEAATRETGDDVLITESTRALLGRDLGGWEERPPIPLRGKGQPIALYAPRAPEAQPAPDA